MILVFLHDSHVYANAYFSIGLLILFGDSYNDLCYAQKYPKAVKTL